MLARGLVLVVAGVAVIAAVAVLRLLAGPIELEFLHDMAQREFITSGGKVKLTAARVMAEWSAIGQPIQLVLQDIQAVDEAGRVIAGAPSIALSFDPRSVLAGKLAPTAVVILKPRLDADIRKGGLLRAMLNQGESQPQTQVAALVIDQLLAELNGDRLLGQLDTVLIEQAHLTLRDSSTGLSWTAPAAKASLKRGATGVVISAEARFDNGSEPIHLAVSGNYSRDRSHVSLETRAEGVRLSQFADFGADLAVLRGIDLPLSGRFRVEASGSGEIESVSIEVTGRNGRITLPDILPVGHPVQSLHARLMLDAVAHSLRIESMEADLGAVKLRVGGAGVIKDREVTFAGRAELSHVPVDRIGDYWPIQFARGGRDWSIANVSGGEVAIGGEFALSGMLGKLDEAAVDRAVVTLDYRGLNVRYMTEMPVLEGVSGTARYEGDTLHFDIAGGRGAGLAVTGATVDMTELNGPTQYASIKVPITGQAGAVMDFLARPRLGLPKDMLYDAKRVSGDVAAEVTLRFPLINALTLADLDIKAEAALSGFVLREALGKVDLTDATAKVIYSGPELRIAGQGKFDGSNLDFSWRELFGARQPFRRRYEVKGTAPTAMFTKAGLPDVEPAISGPVGVNLSYQVALNGTSEMVGRFDLKGAKWTIPALAWTKDAGTEGQISTTVRMAPGAKLTTIDFDGRAAGLSSKGQARFGSSNDLQQMTLQQFSLGRSDLSAEWRRADNGMEIAIRGRTLEWSRVRQFLHSREQEAQAHAAAPQSPPSTARVAVSVALDQVLVERGTLGGVSGSFEIVGDRMNFADLNMPAAGGSTFRIAPSGQGRTVKININNLGQMLKNAGWLDGLVGAWLAFDGRFDESKPVAPVTGKLSMGQYRMEIVTPRPGIGTLNSTIEGLSRAGNALQTYEILEADIVKTGERVEIKKGRTNGQSIGLTAQGVIDLANDTVQMRGVVVPAFALNNVLSNVPLLGPLLTGGRDGGLFAISYRLEGPLDDPKASINPMSAITPGALREIFNGGGDPSQGPTNPEIQRVP